MRSRSDFAHYSFLLIAALAGCAPDRVAAPGEHRPATPAADILNLSGTDPLLYDQSSWDLGSDSQTSEAGNHRGDEFVVPVGEAWTVTQVVISGVLGMETLPFAIRANNAGVPGAVIQSFTLAPTASFVRPCDCYNSDGTPAVVYDYLFALSTPVSLTPGTYWLTVGPMLPGMSFFWMQHEHIGLYGADSDDNGSTWMTPSNEYVFVLFGSRRVAQAISFPAITPNPAVVLSNATLGATSSSNLAVSYSSLTPNVCAVTGNTVSYTNVGTCTVAADQAGDANHFPASQETQSVDVAKITQTITFASAPPQPAYVNATYTVAATGGASGNSAAITVGPPNVCVANGTAVRFVGVGTCGITANQTGNDLYAAAAPVTQSVKVDYRYTGFLDPVNSAALNVAKAGQVIPLKWRLTDVNGAPVTTLTSAAVTAKELSCALAGATKDQVTESASGGSGLQNLGDGYYQLNWKVPASYANSCKTLQLDLGEGSGPRTARFGFTK